MINAPKISLSCRKSKTQWIHKTERTIKGSKSMTLLRPKDLQNWEESKIRCQKCLPCALFKSVEIGNRVQDELLAFPTKALFLTLTVSEENMQDVFPNYELSRKPWQQFMKKIRKRFEGVDEIIHPTNGKKYKPIRYFMCGEYGEQNLRPHYHAIIFNWTPEDLITKRGTGKYTKYFSKTLEELWPHGLIDIGSASLEAGAYIGRYTAKKYRQKDNPLLIGKTPAFLGFPSSFGLGRLTYDKYHKDWYNKDFRWTVKELGSGARANTGAFKSPIAQYYNRLRRKQDSESYEKIVEKRVQKGQEELLKKYKNSSIYQHKVENTKGNFTEHMQNRIK